MEENPTSKVIFLDADASYSFDSVIKVLTHLTMMLMWFLGLDFI